MPEGDTAEVMAQLITRDVRNSTLAAVQAAIHEICREKKIAAEEAIPLLEQWIVREMTKP